MTRLRWLRRALFGLVAITAALLAAAAWVIATPQGTAVSARFVAGQVDGLAIGAISGDLASGISIDGAGWHGNGVNVRIRQLRLRLQWAALLRGRLLLSEFHAGNVNVEFVDNPSSNQTTGLPELALPLTVVAPALAVDEATIADTLITALHSRLVWSGATLRITGTRAKINGITLAGQARLAFEKHYPLQAEVTLQGEKLPAPVRASAKGDLKLLQIDADTGGQWPLHAHAVIAALAQPLALEVTVHQNGPMQWPIGGETLQAHDATITAAGTVEQLQGQFSTGLVLPGLGQTTLSGAIAWRQPQLTIGQWRLQLPNGAVSGLCSAIVGAQNRGNCRGRIDSVALDPWLPAGSGSVSSDFDINASLSQDRMQLAAALRNINGRIGSTPVAGAIAVTTNDARLWHLDQLRLGVGDNHLRATGEVGSNNNLHVTFNAPDLAQIPTALTGSLGGIATVTGAWPDLTVSASVDGKGLHWQQWRAGALHARIGIASAGNRQSRLALRLTDATAGQGPPLALAVAANGDRSAQHVTATLTYNGATMLSLRCDQRLLAGGGSGSFTCPQLQGNLPVAETPVAWRQRSQLQGEWVADPRQISIDPLCIVAGEASLCWHRPLQWGSGKLQPTTVVADAIPLQWGRGYLPPGLALHDDPRATLRINVDGLQPLAVDADLRIDRVQWQWPGHPNELTGLDQVAAHASLTPDTARFTASAHSPDLGQLQSNLTVTEPTGTGKLDGELHIAGLNLSGFAWAIDDLEKLAGTAAADIIIGGRFDAPTLDGRLMLADGQLQWGPMPEPVENIHLTARFDQRHVAFSGGFDAAGGNGNVDGNLDWHGLPENWQLAATLSADKLTLAPLPDSEVTVSGKVSVDARPELVKIGGDARIAKADIALKELPPESVGVSPDAEVVGRQAPPQRWQFQANVNLDLGDKFHFSGFGADVDLSGTLRLRQQPGQPFKVSGEVTVPQGRYHAYGQRLKIRHGSFVFDGPWDNPNLQLEAVREMPPTSTTVVGLRVSGPLQDPKAELFSVPSMPETDVAYYFLTGKPPSEAGRAARSSAGATALSLGLAGGSGQAAKLAEKVGITDFRIGTVQTESGPEAQVSGYVTPDLFVSYGTGINRASGEFAFQYQLTSKLAIEAISGLQQSLDLLYSFSVK